VIDWDKRSYSIWCEGWCVEYKWSRVTEYRVWQCH